MSETNPPPEATAVAASLAQKLEARGHEYAIGGAIALGFWGVPRGTIDVDLTLFLAAERPWECIWVLQEIGCEMSAVSAAESLRQHGFCRVKFGGLDVDIFVPLVPFYEIARRRRKRVELAGRPIQVWDAESLVVFKMMFFRRKDMADIEQVLMTQGARFDRAWVRDQLVAIYGARDPRLSAWDDLVRDVPPT